MARVKGKNSSPSPLCPKCKGNTTYIHDLKCTVCDNSTVVYCPSCQVHIRITGEIS